VCAVTVYLALYVVYVLVVVFGRVIYQYYKQRTAQAQQASINVVTEGSLFSLSLFLTVTEQYVLQCDCVANTMTLLNSSPTSVYLWLVISHHHCRRHYHHLSSSSSSSCYASAGFGDVFFGHMSMIIH